MPVRREKPLALDASKHINTNTDLLYSQVGLSHVHSSYMRTMLLTKLYDYGDNGPINVGKAGPSSKIHEVLKLLARHEIVGYKSDSPNYYRVYILNRFKLERIRQEMIWKAEISKRRLGPPKTPNIVYYDTESGELSCNGLRKRLTRRNKKLFTALFVASPDYASRHELMSLARMGKYANDPSMYVLSEAFTNLRKVCGVNADVIELNSNGGRLNASCHPLSAQLPPSDFLTD